MVLGFSSEILAFRFCGFGFSSYIAVGLYLFDFDCFEYIKSIEKSERGEYEITSLIEKYLHIGNLNYKFANGWWIDAGTPEAIRNIENLI